MRGVELNRGALKLAGSWSVLQSPAAFEAWLVPREQVQWVTYIQPPPQRDTAPEQVLKYLARYLTGGPTSDRRLISHEQGQVTFWARSGVKAGGDRDDRQPVTLPGREFVRLWSLHILPKGFVKTRCFGGYSNRQRQQFLQAYQELVPAVAPGEPPATADPATPANGSETELTVLSCPHCGARMNCIASRYRDSWSIIMTDVHRPRWYLDGS